MNKEIIFTQKNRDTTIVTFNGALVGEKMRAGKYIKLGIRDSHFSRHEDTRHIAGSGACKKAIRHWKEDLIPKCVDTLTASRSKAKSYTYDYMSDIGCIQLSAGSGSSLTRILYYNSYGDGTFRVTIRNHNLMDSNRGYHKIGGLVGSYNIHFHDVANTPLGDFVSCSISGKHFTETGIYQSPSQNGDMFLFVNGAFSLKAMIDEREEGFVYRPCLHGEKGGSQTIKDSDGLPLLVKGEASYYDDTDDADYDF